MTTINYTSERQGKCETCHVRYIWPAKQCTLKRALCPKCGSKLKGTTHLLQWPVEYVSAVRKISRLSA